MLSCSLKLVEGRNDLTHAVHTFQNETTLILPFKQKVHTLTQEQLHLQRYGVKCGEKLLAKFQLLKDPKKKKKKNYILTFPYHYLSKFISGPKYLLILSMNSELSLRTTNSMAEISL